MTILKKDDVTQALRLRFEEDRRYHVLRNLLPITEWPLCLYDPSLTIDARQERQEERQKAGTLIRNVSDKRTAEDDEAVYDALLARVRIKAQENELLWMMHEKPFVAWDEEAVREFTRTMLECEAASTYECEGLLLHMDLSTLAWVLGLPASEDDEASVAGLRRELEVAGKARQQIQTPGSDTLLGSH